MPEENSTSEGLPREGRWPGSKEFIRFFIACIAAFEGFGAVG